MTRTARNYCVCGVSLRSFRWIASAVLYGCLGLPTFAQVVDPAIAGRYQGNGIISLAFPPPHISGFVSVTVDLSSNGAVSGSFGSTGGGATGMNGCVFTGSITAIYNSDSAFFAGDGRVTLSGCSDSRINSTPTLNLFGDTRGMTLGLQGGTIYGELLIGVTGLVRTSGPGGDTGSTLAQQRATLAGMWYNPDESGWGLSVTLGSTSAQIPFVVLYVYSGAQPTWFVMPSGAWIMELMFQGDLYATTGVDYRAPTFDPSRVTVTKVGTLTVMYSPNSAPRGGSGLVAYSIRQPDGTTFRGQKVIVKQAF